MKTQDGIKRLKRVVIYFRYSRKPRIDPSNKNLPEFHQATANSELRQCKDCEAYAVQNGWEIVEWVGDQETPGDLEKPNLNELARRCKNKEIEFDSILVHEWSRLTRKNTIDIYQDVEWLRSENKTIEICYRREIDLNDHYSVEEAVREAHWANLEIERLSSRVISGTKAKLLNGELGFQRAPFGFDKSVDSKSLVPNQDADLVKQMFKAVVDGTISECIPLMARGEKYQKPNDKGKMVVPNAASVKQVLRNPIYMGIRTHGVQETGKHNTYTGKKVTVHFKNNKLANRNININQLETDDVIKVDYRDKMVALVSESLFRKVQKKLDRQKRTPKRSTGNSKYRYVGKVKCGHCGGYLSGQTSRLGTVSYICKNSKSVSTGKCNDGLGNKMIHEEILDNMFFNLLKNNLKSNGFYAAAYKYCKDIYQKEIYKKTGQFESMKVKYDRAVQNFAKFQSDYLTELQTPAIQATLKALSLKVKELENELSGFEKTKPSLVHMVQQLNEEDDIDESSFIAWFLRPMFLLAEKEEDNKDSKHAIKEFNEDWLHTISLISLNAEKFLGLWEGAYSKGKNEFIRDINDETLKVFMPSIEWECMEDGLRKWKGTDVARHYNNLVKLPKNIPTSISVAMAFGFHDNYASVIISSTALGAGSLEIT